MELEIGMYVRTINGKIWIIKSQQAISGHRKDIINASYDIIDLIEEGDVIHFEFCGIDNINDVMKEDDILNVGFDEDGDILTLKDINIKSIVTHEQFSQMEYRIGE